jgi:hypothetical protein
MALRPDRRELETANFHFHNQKHRTRLAAPGNPRH